MNTAISLPVSKQTLSHNLLTPLTGILGNIQLFDQATSQVGRNPEQLKILTSHLKEIWHDVKLSAEDILKFARCVIAQAENLRLQENTDTTNVSKEKKLNQWLSVLVVEDNPMIQNIHRNLLENLNCKVDLASNGYQALDALRETHHVILMDIEMPGINGVETALKIRQRDIDKRNIPIIAVTANHPDTQKESEKAIFDAFIQKPLDANHLQELLKRFGRQ